MKNLLLGFAVVALTVACKSGENRSVSDATTAEGPAAACATTEGCDKATDCADMDASACAEKTSCDSAAKAECSGEKAQVCPVTGEAVEN